MNLLFIFLTGLTTGGLSCLAMQGGLLTSVIANQKEQEIDTKEKKKASLKTFDTLDWLPVTIFLITKLISHTLLGFLLGLIGSAITLSLNVRLAFQVFTALFMFATAMNLLDAHPIFRYVVFQPPKFLQRWIRNTSKSKALFAPGLLGLMTIFIPCGVTQAMEVLAINSGNPIYGALIMFSFVLGTSPLFAVLGVLTAKLSETWNQAFTKIASLTLLFMSLYSINGVLLVIDSPLALDFSTPQAQVSTVPINNGVQQVTLQVLNTGYQPQRVRVKSGIPVQLTLESKETYSCAVAFVFKEFGISTFLNSTDSQSFTFTPTKKGNFTFTCSMGMYTGVMEVI